jgi:pyruvate dehydrogenase E2 component (dihydrolipoyllysine-residue acetyltransferase)
MWYMGQRTSVYLDDDLHAAVKASGVPLAELIRRGLGTTAPAQAQPPAPAAPAGPLALPPGEPCPASPAPDPDAGSASHPALASAASPCAPPAAQPSRDASASTRYPRAPRVRRARHR